MGPSILASPHPHPAILPTVTQGPGPSLWLFSPHCRAGLAPRPAALHVLAESGRPAHVLINLSLILFTQRCWENEMRSWLQKHFGRLYTSHSCGGGDISRSLDLGGWRGRERKLKINFAGFPKPGPVPHQLLACKRQPHSGLGPLASQAALSLIQLSGGLALCGHGH